MEEQPFYNGDFDLSRQKCHEIVSPVAHSHNISNSHIPLHVLILNLQSINRTVC